MNAGGKRLFLLPQWLGQGNVRIKHPQLYEAALASLAHQKAMQQTIEWTSLATNKPVWWRRLMLFWKGWWPLNYQSIPALKSITSIKATRNTFRSFFGLILNFHKTSVLSIALCSSHSILQILSGECKPWGCVMRCGFSGCVHETEKMQYPAKQSQRQSPHKIQHWRNGQ